ncbi:DNA ligase [Emticicia aquatica]|uniref:DNA ligase n=1 Tax=Emticicia aquatica TaxID=1681835 RepID=A0ABM9AKZ6_9BACT|nr:NAD-dependent DNA ligase LigA [Emticicia aquatica]CAH0994445.1 DNA ligase [Emticicia aquatica]
MNPAERIAELTEKLNYYNQRYYVDSVSEISDQNFDLMLKELENLETQYPDLKLLESPTHRVGGTVTKNFASVEHRYPMLSLANTYNEQELIDFDERVRKGLNGEAYEYICELKFDGISLSMTYENGIFVRGVTRGDGVRGDDITNNVKTIKTIPLKVNPKSQIANLLSFEIRGEGFLPYSSFEKMNADAEAAGEESYANARNAASGSFKLQDSAEVARRGLDAYVYQFLSDEEIFSTHEESLIALKNLGFNVSPTWQKCSDIQDVMAYIKLWDEKRFSLPLATDGIVIKLNSIAQRAELGYTAKSPRWAIAYKYKAESKPAILKAVTYQVGRTGAITPVAELDNEKRNNKGIHLSGTTVKRASLHNANEIERLGLRIGDTVFVEKGGEIIPKVTAVDLSKRDMFNTQEIVYPTNCPECGAELTRKEGEANHYCPNEKGCPPQIRGKIEHFIHRKAMNIDSLGEGKIELLYDKGLVRDVTDLYDLTYEKLFGLEKITEDEVTGKIRKIGFKEKTVQNILEGIEKSKQVPFKQVLFGIGIRYVGATVAEKLASFFKNIDNIKNADYETLRTAPEIGDKIAQSIVEYFQNDDNQIFIEKLRLAGLQFAAQDEIKEIESDQLTGKTFLYTGTFENFEREALEQKIEANGGKVVSGVSGKLDFLIVGEKPGSSKIEKAKKLNVTMISEEEFMAMLN